MLLPHEQFLGAIKRAERPLIVLKELAHVDEFAAAFGLANLFEKLGKHVDIVSSGGRAPEVLAFLPGDRAVKGDLPNIRALSIHLNVSKAKVDELSYNVDNEQLTVHITPKTGFWTPEDVRVATTSYRYDLIITLGAPDLASLGKTYAQYTDFFLHTTIVSIDHSAANEHYASINVVDAAAVAVGEVLFDTFMRLDPTLVEADIATCFLAGMIAKTHSFRTPNVTPRTLATAAKLIEKGARRDEIVERLYRTRSVETLRLWGRALARLKSDSDCCIVWTLLTRQDFMQAGAQEEALADIVQELLTNSPDSKVVAIFFEETSGTISVHLHAQRPHDALQLGAPFKASGTRELARLSINESDIVVAEKQVISHLQSVLERKG